MASWLRIPRRRTEIGIHPLSSRGSSSQEICRRGGKRGLYRTTRAFVVNGLSDATEYKYDILVRYLEGKISNIPLKLEKFPDLPNHISYFQIYPAFRWLYRDRRFSPFSLFPLFFPTSRFTVPFNLSLVLEYGLSLVNFRPIVFQWIALLRTNPLNLRSMRNSTVFQLSNTRAALLDVYEFVPEKVDSKRYTLKCKDKECPWHLHATSIPETDTWHIRT
jgi:hypothetical protein